MALKLVLEVTRNLIKIIIFCLCVGFGGSILAHFLGINDLGEIEPTHYLFVGMVTITIYHFIYSQFNK